MLDYDYFSVLESNRVLSRTLFFHFFSLSTIKFFASSNPPAHFFFFFLRKNQNQNQTKSKKNPKKIQKKSKKNPDDAIDEQVEQERLDDDAAAWEAFFEE